MSFGNCLSLPPVIFQPYIQGSHFTLMLDHILRLETGTSWDWVIKVFFNPSLSMILSSSGHDECSVNNAILSVVPTGAPQLCLEVTLLSKRWQTGFLSQAECHVTAQGPVLVVVAPWLFEERCAAVAPSHPAPLAGGDKTAHLQLWHFSGRKKGRRHQAVGRDQSSHL